MEKVTLDHQIQLICQRATSFPDGIADAYHKLMQVDSSFASRTLYGVSHGSDSGILYWAAVEAKSKTEADQFGLEQYTIKKGVYVTETLKDIRGNEHRIGDTFEKLLSHPQLDETGECIEWYKNNNEVQCMVRILE